MASMRDIKRRKESITSTSQITKAMKLVSTVKLQHAKGRAKETKPYFDKMYETVSGMLAKSPESQPSSFDRENRRFREKRCDYDHLEPWACRRVQFQCREIDHKG